MSIRAIKKHKAVVNMQSPRGFTLVEMVVYVAIVALVFFIIFNMVLVIAESNKEFRVSRNIQNAATTAIERMTRDIHGAVVVNTAQSTLGSHPGTLHISTEEGDGTEKTLEFSLTDGRIYVAEDGVSLGPITPQNTEVTHLVFHVGSTGVNQMARIEMTISSAVGSVSKEETFYMTSVVRGSY